MTLTRIPIRARLVRLHLLVLLAASGVLAAGEGPSHDPVAAVARVGDLVIDQAAFEDGFARAERDTAMSEAEGRRDYLDTLVNRHLLVLAAREAGMLGPDSLLDERLRRYEEGLLEGRVREIDIRGKIQLTDAAVDSFYAKQAVLFDMSYIVTATREEAEDVLARLAAGEDFAALARAVSLDTKTADKGGRFEPFLWGMTTMEFLRELETMRPGEIRGPIRSEDGYYVLRLHGLIPNANRPPLAEQRDFLKERCRLFNEMVLQIEYYAGLDRKYHFEPNWPAVAGLARRVTEALGAAAEQKLGVSLDEQAESAMTAIVLPESLLALPVATWDFGRYLVRDEWDYVSGMPGAAFVDRRNPNQAIVDAAREFHRAAMVHEARVRGIDRDPEIRRRLEVRREHNAVSQFYRTQIMGKAAFTEEEERAYFKSHPDQFVVPKQVRGLRIQYLDAAAAEELERAYRAPGGNPDSLVGVHLSHGAVRSRDPEGKWFVEAEHPLLFERADSMQPGEAARLVDEEGYWTVFVLLERQDEQKPPFEEVRMTVQKSLRNQRADEILNRLLTELRAKYPVWVDEDYLARSGGGR